MKTTLSSFFETGLAALLQVRKPGGGFEEQATHAVINTLCPNTLFPYARHSIASPLESS